MDVAAVIGDVKERSFLGDVVGDITLAPFGHLRVARKLRAGGPEKSPHTQVLALGAKF